MIITQLKMLLIIQYWDYKNGAKSETKIMKGKKER